jgi:hypothetical protein
MRIADSTRTGIVFATMLLVCVHIVAHRYATHLWLDPTILFLCEIGLLSWWVVYSRETRAIAIISWILGVLVLFVLGWTLHGQGLSMSVLLSPAMLMCVAFCRLVHRLFRVKVTFATSENDVCVAAAYHRNTVRCIEITAVAGLIGIIAFVPHLARQSDAISDTFVSFDPIYLGIYFLWMCFVTILLSVAFWCVFLPTRLIVKGAAVVAALAASTVVTCVGMRYAMLALIPDGLTESVRQDALRRTPSIAALFHTWAEIAVAVTLLCAISFLCVRFMGCSLDGDTGGPRGGAVGERKRTARTE